jgi:hypothetical protein
MYQWTPRGVFRGTRSPDLQSERYTREQAATRPILRRAHSDAGAVADLVLLVQGVDEIYARGQRTPPADVENMVDAEIYLGVVG